MPRSIREDMHVHSTFSDGRHSVRDNVRTAEALGLERLGCVDHVRHDTDWLPAFVDTVDDLRGGALELWCGVEAKLLDAHGSLDLPPVLHGVDRVYIADHQWPLGDRVVPPSEIRAARRAGAATGDLLRWLVRGTEQAMRHSPRPAVLAHLFSTLRKVGLAEDDVSDAALARLARVAADTGTLLELDERWRCPGTRVAQAFLAEGVPVLYSTDSHRRDHIGQYRWAPTVLA